MTATDDLRQRIADAIQPLLMDTLPKPIAGARAQEVADVALAAIQGAYVPPPPGSDRDALPPDLRRLIEPQMPPYTSTACQTARACTLAAEVFSDRAAELLTWAQREHLACRRTRKQDMVTCGCDCHRQSTR